MSIYTQAKPAGTPTWADLMTPDADAARAFYKAIFGWDYDIGGPEYGGYTTIRLGDYMIGGLSGMPPGMPPRTTAWGLYFATDDINADVARAVALGATLMYPPMFVDPFGHMVSLQDPTGAVFSLWQAGLNKGWQVNNQPGSTAWHELYTPDAQKAVAFYTALLGASSNRMEGDFEYYVLNHDNDSLCGVMQIDPTWGDVPPRWINYFAVANAVETAALITKLGGQIMGNVDDTSFGKLVSAMDPFGAAFKILQPPATSSQ